MSLKNRINISLMVHAKVEKKVKDYVLKKLGQRFLYNPIDDGGFFYCFCCPWGVRAGKVWLAQKRLRKNLNSLQLCIERLFGPFYIFL